MKRREFLIGALSGAALSRLAWASELPADIRITRIVGFDLPTKRNKVAGRNSHKDVHGDQGRDRMVRLYTNAGLEGLGNCRAKPDALAALLGKNPFDFFKREERRFDSPLGAGTMPLWDLAGKALGAPAFELLGGAGPRRVPVYDGSIYMQDLLPQYADRWADRFREEIDVALAAGHRAFKAKIGRGFKWMPLEEGDARDVEVLKVIRAHTGPEIIIGVDANDGYDLARTKRLLERLPEYNFAFLEEMFHEDVKLYTELKTFMNDRGLATFVADGENWGEAANCRTCVEAGIVDIYQGDMNQFGFEGILQEAAMARPKGFTVAPHNWGSLVGYYMQLHVGRAIPNFYRAEQDPLSSDILIADGYSISEGTAAVPDAPGFGLKIDEEKFAARIKPVFDLKV